MAGKQSLVTKMEPTGSPTNPPWAPGSDKTRGQGSITTYKQFEKETNCTFDPLLTKTGWYGGTERTPWHICFSIIDLYIFYLNYWPIYISIIFLIFYQQTQLICPLYILSEIRYIQVSYWDIYFSRPPFGTSVGWAWHVTIAICYKWCGILIMTKYNSDLLGLSIFGV